MVCKISYLLWFPDIPNKAGRKTRRRRTHAISKCYAFHAHTIKRDINYLSYHIKKFIKWSPGSVLQKPTNFSKLFVWYCSTEIKKKIFLSWFQRSIQQRGSHPEMLCTGASFWIKSQAERLNIFLWILWKLLRIAFYMTPLNSWFVQPPRMIWAFGKFTSISSKQNGMNHNHNWKYGNQYKKICVRYLQQCYW